MRDAALALWAWGGGRVWVQLHAEYISYLEKEEPVNMGPGPFPRAGCRLYARFPQSQGRYLCFHMCVKRFCMEIVNSTKK